MLQKWLKEVHVESILHPTPSMNVDGSSTCVAEAWSTPLDPVPPSSIPSGIVVAAPFGDNPTSPSGCPGAEQILADVCKALRDSQGSFHPSMSEVEALLGNDWRQQRGYTASERGAASEVAHKWARWLHNPCRLGGPHCFRAGARIRGGPQVGKVAT